MAQTAAHPAAHPAAEPARFGHHAVWTHRRFWRWTGYTALVALIGVEIALMAPYLDHAASKLRSIDPGWLVLALVAEAASMGTFARVQRRMLDAAGRHVTVPPVVALTYAANALSVTLPGGTAISAGYVFRRLRRWGATVPAASFTVIASGVLSVIAFAVLAVVGGVVAGGDDLSSWLLLGAVAAGGIAWAVVRRRGSAATVQRALERGATRANRLLRRRPDAGIAAVRRFARELTAIRPTRRDWLIGLWLAGLNWLLDLTCLIACCQAVGADRAGLELVTIAYIAGMSAASVSVVPGGFGIVDAAMIVALTSGHVGTAAATAGVVLYRLISFALVVFLGWVVWGTAFVLDRRRKVTEVAAVADVVAVTEVAPAVESERTVTLGES